jgi:hypothetical protein
MIGQFGVEPTNFIICRCIEICRSCGFDREAAEQFLGEAKERNQDLERACGLFRPPLSFDHLPVTRFHDPKGRGDRFRGNAQPKKIRPGGGARAHDKFYPPKKN